MALPFCWHSFLWCQNGCLGCCWFKWLDIKKVKPSVDLIIIYFYYFYFFVGLPPIALIKGMIFGSMSDLTIMHVVKTFFHFTYAFPQLTSIPPYSISNWCTDWHFQVFQSLLWIPNGGTIISWVRSGVGKKIPRKSLSNHLDDFTTTSLR